MIKWTALPPLICGLLRMLFGALVCGTGAFGASLLFRGTSVATGAPIVFLLVIAIVVRVGGKAAGLSGVAIAAIVFARSLFPPLHSISIRNGTERASLAWMLLFGVVISWFFSGARQDEDRESKPKDSRARE